MRARLCRSPGQHPPCLQLTMRDLHDGPARFRNGTARPAAWCFLHDLPRIAQECRVQHLQLAMLQHCR